MSTDPHVLVVAGSDSSGGAGIARDIETIASIGVRTCLAVTALTVQTHDAVDQIEPVSPQLVTAQMQAAFAANHVAAIKIGMLATNKTVSAVAAILREYAHIPIVLDPVLASSSGRALLPKSAIAAMKCDLIPLCSLVTPNLVELAIFAESAPIDGEEAVLLQGAQLLTAGCDAVLAKGGHASGARSTDILLRPHQLPLPFDAPRLQTQVRGTGCMLASAIAAHLALQRPLEASVGMAKQYVFDRLATSGK